MMSSGLEQGKKDRLQNWFANLRNPQVAKAMKSLEEKGMIKTGIDEFGVKVCWLTEKGLTQAQADKSN